MHSTCDTVKQPTISIPHQVLVYRILNVRQFNTNSNIFTLLSSTTGLQHAAQFFTYNILNLRQFQKKSGNTCTDNATVGVGPSNSKLTKRQYATQDAIFPRLLYEIFYPGSVERL